VKTPVLVALLGSGLAIGLACSHLAASSEHARLLAAEAGTVAVDDADCLMCHADQGEELSHTVHRKVLGCQQCHGPGKNHVEDPPGHIAGAKSLRALSPFAQSEMCLGCHGSLALAWNGSDHASASVPCARCHSDVVHFKPSEAVKPLVAFRKQQGFCQQCHGLDALGFQQVFHHPVPEGAMDCTSCHAVHGKLQNDMVAVDESGPCGHCHRRQVEHRVFQHAALREGCLTCHQAHGSPLRALLTEPANTLCLKCHLQAGFPVIEDVDHTTMLAGGARCYDCHVEVHGSNTDPTLLGRLR
jgi:DmsE family decaheme c-type cytochrome